MTVAQIIILCTMVLYLGFMLVVGFICSKKNNTSDDFYLGGRKLGPFVTAMSAEASDMSYGFLWDFRVLHILQVSQMRDGQL